MLQTQQCTSILLIGFSTMCTSNFNAELSSECVDLAFTELGDIAINEMFRKCVDIQKYIF